MHKSIKHLLKTYQTIKTNTIRRLKTLNPKPKTKGKPTKPTMSIPSILRKRSSLPTREDFIAQYLKPVFTSPSELDPCPICRYVPYDNSAHQAVHFTAPNVCTHVFGKSCILESFNGIPNADVAGNENCPLCRKQLFRIIGDGMVKTGSVSLGMSPPTFYDLATSPHPHSLNSILGTGGATGLSDLTNALPLIPNTGASSTPPSTIAHGLFGSPNTFLTPVGNGSVHTYTSLGQLQHMHQILNPSSAKAEATLGSDSQDTTITNG